MNPRTAVAEALHVEFSFPDAPRLLQDLSFKVLPGLTLVRGGDGRGKTSVLRLLAGALQPQAGLVRCHTAHLWFEDPTNPDHDALPAQAWLAARAHNYAAWNAGVAAALADAFALAPHLHKPLFMLSTGSRRKLALVGAAASGAGLTLLDTPFAALDMPACRVLGDLLLEAAAQRQRAWVVADAQPAAVLKNASWAGVIDLGD